MRLSVALQCSRGGDKWLFCWSLSSALLTQVYAQESLCHISKPEKGSKLNKETYTPAQFAGIASSESEPSWTSTGSSDCALALGLEPASLMALLGRLGLVFASLAGELACTQQQIVPGRHERNEQREKEPKAEVRTVLCCKSAATNSLVTSKRAFLRLSGALVFWLAVCDILSNETRAAHRS